MIVTSSPVHSNYYPVQVPGHSVSSWQVGRLYGTSSLQSEKAPAKFDLDYDIRSSCTIPDPKVLNTDSQSNPLYGGGAECPTRLGFERHSVVRSSQVPSVFFLHVTLVALHNVTGPKTQF